MFVEDRFFHADLGFSLRFPYGWETSNEPARVMAIAPKRDGVVLLELQGSGSDPIAAAREYAELEALPLEHGTPLRIGELPAFRAVAIVPTAFGALNAEITWVAFENRVYRLLGGMRGGQVGKYQGLFRKFAQSFRPITPEEASVDRGAARAQRARAARRDAHGSSPRAPRTSGTSPSRRSPTACSRTRRSRPTSGSRSR